MKHLNCILATLTLASSGSIYGKSPSLHLPKLANGDKPRNVVFILSDDHRYDYMGFIGKVPGSKHRIWTVWLLKVYILRMHL